MRSRVYEYVYTYLTAPCLRSLEGLNLSHCERAALWREICRERTGTRESGTGTRAQRAPLIDDYYQALSCQTLFRE